MNSIESTLTLFSIKGNVSGGKHLLFKLLENKFSFEEIQKLVVDDYQIMKPKHFISSWNDYNKTKRYLVGI
tara:strand:+ start:331 stop:543 length:213 start_codon:yes stop_codon:yes gene_type:complete